MGCIPEENGLSLSQEPSAAIAPWRRWRPTPLHAVIFLWLYLVRVLHMQSVTAAVSSYVQQLYHVLQKSTTFGFCHLLTTFATSLAGTGCDRDAQVRAEHFSVSYSLPVDQL